MSALLEAIEDERDRGLVERHQAGDDAAFSELYALHYGRLVRFCKRLVRDSHVAEELAQDAFLRAYTSMDRLAGERRFYPWLTVIARRLVIDHVRRDGRVQPHANVEPVPAGATEDVVVQRLDGDHLLTALDRVRDRHRQVLHLRDWEGLSYEAIADRLGLAPTAVPPLLHRARLALRREYMLVTEGRVAAFLPLSAVTLAVRRLRDRVALWTSWLPDAGAISAPMAGAVLAVGALLTVSPGAADAAGHRDAGTAAAVEDGHAAGSPAQLGEAPRDTTHGLGGRLERVPPPAPGGEPREVLVPDVAHVTLDPRPDADGSRPHDKEQPIYLNFGPVGYAGDPERTAGHFKGVAEDRLP
ncbi:MAG TPA: RNA polymerase sigma factor [Egibacteraceae bacterium]|nr:RNA polymerase sigma factor [Egibacteraceae bacterium]